MGQVAPNTQLKKATHKCSSPGAGDRSAESIIINKLQKSKSRDIGTLKRHSRGGSESVSSKKYYSYSNERGRDILKSASESPNRYIEQIKSPKR